MRFSSAKATAIPTITSVPPNCFMLIECLWHLLPSGFVSINVRLTEVTGNRIVTEFQLFGFYTIYVDFSWRTLLSTVMCSLCYFFYFSHIFTECSAFVYRHLYVPKLYTVYNTRPTKCTVLFFGYLCYNTSYCIEHSYMFRSPGDHHQEIKSK
jgi:hypothetical protein